MLRAELSRFGITYVSFKEFASVKEKAGNVEPPGSANAGRLMSQPTRVPVTVLMVIVPVDFRPLLAAPSLYSSVTSKIVWVKHRFDPARKTARTMLV